MNCKPSKQAPKRVLVQAPDPNPAKGKNLHSEIIPMKPEGPQAAESGVSPHKVWWPEACRGIVG
jgi:hypothetical protein